MTSIGRGEAIQKSVFRIPNKSRIRRRESRHASPSHELFLEPMPARSADLGKHSVYTHFPKDRIARSVGGPKSQGPSAEDALAELYLVLNISVTW